MQKNSKYLESVLLNTLYADTGLIPSVQALLEPKDFSDPRNREIYELFVMGADMDQNATAIQSSVYHNDELKAHFNIGYALGGNRKDYMQIARDIASGAKLRKLKEICNQVNMDGTCTLESSLDKLQKALLSASEGEKGSSHTLTQILQKGAAERLISRPREEAGIETSFYLLNKVWQAKPNKMIVIAARASIGKTAFAMTIASQFRKQNKRGLFFSLEMDGDELTERLAAIETGINLEKMGRLETADEVGVMGRFINDELNSNFIIYEKFSPKLSEIRIEVIKRHNESKLDFIVIDYLQLIAPPKKGTMEEAVAAISAACKGMAKEFNVPVFVLAQLNRGAEGEPPKLSHLRGSGAIEQDADVVFLLDRDRKAQVMQKEGEPLNTQLILAKHRGGRTGVFDVNFIPERAVFENNEGKSWN